MPISASQHRISTGNYQNQNYRQTNSSIVHTLKIQPNYSDLSDGGIRHFMSKIGYIHNTPEVLNTQSNLHNTPQNTISIAIQLMLLLSQIKNPEYPVLAANHDLQFISEKKIFSSVSDYALQPDIDSYGLNTIWNPAGNVLNKADKFISWHDPLQFPSADAVPLCRGANFPNDFVSEMNYRGINIIARGLDELKCIDRDKYKFFKRIACNTVKLLNSTIRRLRSKKNSKIDNHLKYYGFVDIDSFKQKLISLYKTIRSETKDMLKNNKHSIYYGYVSIPELGTHKIANMILMNDKERRMLLTDAFFELCTVYAIEIFIHEMSHFHSKTDLFLISPQKSCLINHDRTSEIAIHNQLDEVSKFYVHSINKLNENNIPTDKVTSLVYKLNNKEFLEAFNTNRTVKENAIFINADSISHLAIALGNYDFKKNNIMPLRDISKFKKLH